MFSLDLSTSWCQQISDLRVAPALPLNPLKGTSYRIAKGLRRSAAKGW
jgi:hypothetical protein